MIFSEEHLEHEKEIQWEIPVGEVDYVRETTEYAGTRQRPVPCHRRGERVGYATLEEDAPNLRPGTFLRRVFFLKPEDRYYMPDGNYSYGAPSEAVDPRTVEPGKRGEQTERVWRGSGSEAEEEGAQSR